MSRPSLPHYEVFAVRYATVQRSRRECFIAPDVHDGPMPMDYFVWLVRGAGRQYLVDTGFNAAEAGARKRQLLRCPIGALAALGVRPEHLTDVVITHLHYDHAGNMDLLPAARLHLQESEMHYAVGRFMAFKPLRHAYTLGDVQHMVERVYRDQVVFHRGDSQLAPGIELVHIGGHTMGLQSVRVHTARGWVVLASDATHYYDNIGNDSPFPIVHDVGAMLEGYRKLVSLAESPAHIVPGHDPQVMLRYPRTGSAEDEIVCLHEDARAAAGFEQPQPIQASAGCAHCEQPLSQPSSLGARLSAD